MLFNNRYTHVILCLYLRTYILFSGFCFHALLLLHTETHLRVKEVLEEPSTKNRNSSFRQPSLGPPSIVLDHPQLLQSPLLTNLVIHKLEPRTSLGALSSSRTVVIIFSNSEALARGLDLCRDGVFQAPELLRDRLQSEGGVRFRRLDSSCLLEG